MKTKKITWLIVFFLVCGTTLTAQKKSGFGNILKKVESAAESITGKTETTKTETTKTPASTVSGQSDESDAAKISLTANTKTFLINKYVSKYIFSDGMLCIHNTEKNKYGFIDTEGKLRVDYVWDTNFIYDPLFNSGYCVVHRSQSGKKRYYIIDHDGKETALPETFYQVSDFVEGRAIALDRTNAKLTVMYIDHTGKQLFPELTRNPKSSPSNPGNPRPYKNGLAAFYDATAGKWGFHDEKGKLVIQPQFDNVDDFYEGLASVQESTADGRGKWGYIDATGKMVIEPKFSYMPSCFSEGTAVVRKQNNKYCAIDKTGNVISGEFDKLTPFYEGYAFANTSQYGMSKTVVLDKNFNEFRVIDYFPMPTQEGYPVVRFFNGVAAVGGNTLPTESLGWIINPQGERIMPQKRLYAKIGNFFEGLAYCTARIDNVVYHGFINKAGEYVLIFQKEEF